MSRETCSECGADSYVVWNAENMVAANARFRRSLDATAIDLARAKLRIMELEEREGFNTMKVRRQERAIRKLEEKLRKLGERPYAVHEREEQRTDAALASPGPELPLDLERVLRDPSIIVPQDQAVFEAVARWKNAPSDTASASPDQKEGAA